MVDLTIHPGISLAETANSAGDMLHQALSRQLTRGNAWLASWEPPVNAKRGRVIGVQALGSGRRKRRRKA